MEQPKFEVLVLGIVFDPLTRKVLIGRRENDLVEWCFPGGRLLEGENLDDALKRNIKKKTGYDVKNIGTFFADNCGKAGKVQVMFLTKVFEGEEEAGDDIVELKWISPKEVEGCFGDSLHKKLKEFLLELV